MDHNNFISSAYLARRADREEKNEATLVWMVSWGVLSAASFPVCWALNLYFITIPMAVGVCFVLSALLGLFWLIRAKKVIHSARDEYHSRRRELQKKMQEEHLEKLRKSSL